MRGPRSKPLIASLGGSKSVQWHVFVLRTLSRYKSLSSCAASSEYWQPQKYVGSQVVPRPQMFSQPAYELIDKPRSAYEGTLLDNILGPGASRDAHRPEARTSSGLDSCISAAKDVDCTESLLVMSSYGISRDVVGCLSGKLCPLQLHLVSFRLRKL